MKKFCTLLREHAANITDFELHRDAKISCICRKRFIQKLSKEKNHHKFRDHCHYTGRFRDAAHSI